MDAECWNFRNELGAYLEGEATPEVAAHVERCQHCQAIVEDLRAIERIAPEIAGTFEPRPALWRRIETAAYAEGLVQERPLSGWFRDLVREWWPLPAPALTAAYVLVILIAGAIIGLRTAAPPIPEQQAALPVPKVDIAAELTSAEKTILAEMEKANPQASEIYRYNLATVNYYIDLCQRTLDQDPDNLDVRHSLDQAYTEKGDLLSAMIDPDEMRAR
jgi:hypothetical protein